MNVLPRGPRSSKPGFYQVAANNFGSNSRPNPEIQAMSVYVYVLVVVAVLVVLAWSLTSPVQLRDILVVI